MSSAEVAARYCYGYERATAECRKPELWKGPKKQRRSLDRYDVLSYRKFNAPSPRADAQVVENMNRDALFMRYHEKSNSGEN